MRDIEQITTRSVLLNSGDVLRSRYRILNQLGTWGFSRTYLAEDLNRFNERCVLKQFAPQFKGTFALEKAQELLLLKSNRNFSSNHQNQKFNRYL